MYIKVWCEWDICGTFGNNREDIWQVEDGITEEQIQELLLKQYAGYLDCDPEDAFSCGYIGFEETFVHTLI